MFIRCEWAGDDPLMQKYHDKEWSVPKHDERRLFEDLVLDGAQAGLSWMTICASARISVSSAHSLH